MRRVISKEGVARYVTIMRRMFIGFAVVMIPAALICFAYAFSGYIGFWIISAALVVALIAAYCVYAMYVSMGAVVGFEITDKVLHVKTRRKTFTYDAGMGCVGVKVSRKKFIATFETRDSRDKFIFYRKVWFSKHFEEQFTVEEIKLFYPELAEVEM